MSRFTILLWPCRVFKTYFDGTDHIYTVFCAKSQFLIGQKDDSHGISQWKLFVESLRGLFFFLSLHLCEHLINIYGLSTVPGTFLGTWDSGMTAEFLLVLNLHFRTVTLRYWCILGKPGKIWQLLSIKFSSCKLTHKLIIVMSTGISIILCNVQDESKIPLFADH